MYRLLPEQVPLSDAVHVKTDCECMCLFCCILHDLPKYYECNIGVLLKFGMLLIIYIY